VVVCLIGWVINLAVVFAFALLFGISSVAMG
jgi:hypothetical protein